MSEEPHFVSEQSLQRVTALVEEEDSSELDYVRANIEGEDTVPEALLRIEDIPDIARGEETDCRLTASLQLFSENYYAGSQFKAHLYFCYHLKGQKAGQPSEVEFLPESHDVALVLEQPGYRVAECRYRLSVDLAMPISAELAPLFFCRYYAVVVVVVGRRKFICKRQFKVVKDFQSGQGYGGQLFEGKYVYRTLCCCSRREMTIRIRKRAPYMKPDREEPFTLQVDSETGVRGLVHVGIRAKVESPREAFRLEAVLAWQQVGVEGREAGFSLLLPGERASKADVNSAYSLSYTVEIIELGLGLWFPAVLHELTHPLLVK